MYTLKTDGTGIRYGISISKKSGNAVVRHRFQRVMRAVIRAQKERFLADADIVIVVKKGIRYESVRDITFQKVEQTLLPLLQRAKLCA